MERIDVGVLGATGMVGVRLVRLLEGHPWFRLREVGASDRSKGEPLGRLVADDDGGPLWKEAADMVVKSVDDEYTSPILLSALPTGVARELEGLRPAAAAGHLGGAGGDERAFGQADHEMAGHPLRARHRAERVMRLPKQPGFRQNPKVADEHAKAREHQKLAELAARHVLFVGGPKRDFLSPQSTAIGRLHSSSSHM